MRKRLLKPVALVLAVSFLNTQVLWAASFEKSIVESLIKYWAQGRSVSTLEKNHHTAKNLIEKKGWVNDLVTTASGSFRDRPASPSGVLTLIPSSRVRTKEPRPENPAPDRADQTPFTPQVPRRELSPTELPESPAPDPPAPPIALTPSNFIIKTSLGEAFSYEDGELTWTGDPLLFPSTQGSARITDWFDIQYDAEGRYKEVARRSDGKQLFSYAYRKDIDGEDSVEITDASDNTLKTYKKGELQKSLDLDTSLLSAYFYENQRISRVEVSRLGRVLQTYAYRYEEEKTIVSSLEDGVPAERAFSAAGKLLSLRQGADLFVYAFASDESGEEITVEELPEWSLGGGQKVLYKEGFFDRISFGDAGFVSDIGSEALTGLAQGTIHLAGGEEWVFKGKEVTERLLPDGTRLFYEGQRLVRADDRRLGGLGFTYEKDPQGNVTAVWMERGRARFKYAPEGGLLGVKFLDIPDPEAIKKSAAVAYEGGGDTGPYSHDEGDERFLTSQAESVSNPRGGSGRVESRHLFTSPQTLASLTFKLYASGFVSAPDYNREWHARYNVSVLQDGVWKEVAHESKGGSDNGGDAADSKEVALTGEALVTEDGKPLTNIMGIRAVADGYGHHEDDRGGGGGSAFIYDIHYEVADESFYSFSETPSAHVFKNGRQEIRLGRAGEDLSSSIASLGPVLGGPLRAVSALIRLPHAWESSAALPAEFNRWVDAAQEALKGGQKIVRREFSKDGMIQTQIQADGSVTLFDEGGRPYRVLDKEANTLIRYEYDAGRLSRVYLQHAREILPAEINRLKQEVETRRAESLRRLLDEEDRLNQTLENIFHNERLKYEGFLSASEKQFENLSNMEVDGKDAKNARGEALNELGRQRDFWRATAADFARNEAEAYREALTKSKEAYSTLESDAAGALEELAKKQAELEASILLQEISPLVYDAYRRYQGRNPSTLELREWLEKLDYASGSAKDPQTGQTQAASIKTKDGRDFLAALEEALRTSSEVAARRAYVDAVKNKVVAEIRGFLTRTPEEKRRFAESLRIEEKELADLNADDAEKIIAWLETKAKGLHFGQSAFLSLESLLDQKGIAYSREEIAWKAILIDVLAGIITPLDDGDLVISVFSLNKVAGLYGLRLSGATLDWEDLKSFFDENRLKVDYTTEETIAKDRALYFSGNDALVFQDSDSWDIIGGSATVELWVKHEGLSQTQAYLGHGDSNHHWMLRYVPGEGIEFALSNGSVGDLFLLKGSAAALQDGQWHHIALVKERQEFRLYVDGIKVADAVYSGNDGFSAPLEIGQRPGGGEFFKGWLDGVRLSRTPRYRESFTPPTRAYALEPSDALLLKLTNVSPVGAENVSAATRTYAGLIGSPRVEEGAGALDRVIQVTKTPKITQFPAGVDPQAATEALKKDLLASPDKYNPRALAHLNGNHFVVVTEVREDSVTYLDSGAGPDKQNESVTLSKEDFLSHWKGIIIAEDTALQRLPGLGQQRLSAQETMKIRGAFFPLLVAAIWGAIQSIGAALWAVLNGIGTLMANLGPLIGDILKSVGQTLSHFGQSLGGVAGNLFNGIQFAASSLFGGNASPVAVSADQSFFSFFPKVSFGEVVFQNAVSAGVNYAASRGLEVLGVDPTAADFASAFASGGTTGGLQKGFNIGDFLKAGIENLTARGIQTALESAGLNARLAGLISTQLADSLASESKIEVNRESYYDPEKGRDIPIPGPGSEGGPAWEKVWGFMGKALPVLAAAGLAVRYLSNHKSDDSSSGPSNSATTELPLPDGAAAVPYQDLAGQTREGFRVGSDADYLVYDRASGMPVNRVRGPLAEEGDFEGRFTRESGSLVLDLKTPDTLKSGKITYDTPQGGRVSFGVSEKTVREVILEKPSPDIVLEPGTVKDASNKIIDGVVKLVPLGLTLYVSNRGVSKGRGERALSSGDLARALRKSFLFGNGFENERRAEDTPDPLIKSYVGNLEGEGIINPAKKLLFYLYEMTDLVMNGVDWITDFKKEETRLILDIMDGPLESQIAWIKSLSSLLPVPEPLRAYIQTLKDYLATDWGIGNNLVQEVMRELDQKGPIEDAIAFVHSGATAPLLKALQQKPYDIQTVLIYEGPYPDYGEKILNPNLERIIHVMGTGSPPEGDAYVPFLGKAEFKGVHPDFETINIEIRGAFHSDFSYNPNDYADHTDWNEEKAERQRINRKVNLFMRDLYEATYKDQTEPGRLKDFFDTLIERNAAEKVNGIWKIDSDNLRDIHLP